MNSLPNTEPKPDSPPHSHLADYVTPPPFSYILDCFSFVPGECRSLKCFNSILMYVDKSVSYHLDQVFPGMEKQTTSGFILRIHDLKLRGNIVVLECKYVCVTCLDDGGRTCDGGLKSVLVS